MMRVGWVRGPTTATRRRMPVVVGGCLRSGTSLVRRLLNGHSAIDCAPELPFFRDFRGDYRTDPIAHLRFSRAVRQQLGDDDALVALGRSLVEVHERIARRHGKRRWADKAPENAIHLDLWQQLLGHRWLYVHVVRNPLDAVSSMEAAAFRHTLPDSLQERVAFYRRYTGAGLDWAVRFPERCRVLVYERLVQSPCAELAALMTWLGEEMEPVQLDLDAHNHRAGLEDPKVGRTRAVHSDSMGGWTRRQTQNWGRAVWAGTQDLWKRIDPELELCPLP